MNTLHPIRHLMRRVFCAGLLLAATAGAAPLENPGFETGDFSGWTSFGYGWRVVSDGHAGAGTFALAVDNRLELDEDTWHGVFQNIPVTPRRPYTFGAWIKADDLRYSSAFLEVQWLDDEGRMLHQVRSRAIRRDQPYRRVQLKKIKAPVGAATASLRGVFFMPGIPRNDQGIVYFDDFHVEPK